MTALSNEIDNITIQYDNTIESIELNDIDKITNIILAVGSDAQSVYSVNNLTGAVTLTYTETLSSISSASGVYSYTINHNLNNESVISSIYDSSNKQVLADCSILGYNSIKIDSFKNLNGYKVVVQK